MAFIQVIEFRTDRIDEVLARVDRYLDETEGRRTARRGIVCRDRQDPQHYFDIVFFDSYESAMENSALPETQQLAADLRAMDGQDASYVDLDVVSDRSFAAQAAPA